MTTLLRLHAGSPQRPSIVFVHGLGGNAIDTWRHPRCAADNCWPVWIGEDAECDVWTVGYDGALSGWSQSAMPLPDQGDQVLDRLASEPELDGRAIVMIGHSMGGLVIKTAIVHAMTKGNAKWRELAKRVCACVFIATPHSGSQLANFAGP